MTWTLHARGASEIKSTSSNTGVGQRNRTEEMMWHPKGRKSGSDEERIRAPFVGFARCFFRLCLFFFFFFFLFSFFRFVFGLFFSVGFPVGREGLGAGREEEEEEGGRKRGQRREEVKVGFGGGMVWFWMRSGYFFFFSFGRIRKGFHHFFLVLSEFFFG